MASNEQDHPAEGPISPPIELSSFRERRLNFGRKPVYEQLNAEEVRPVPLNSVSPGVLRTWWVEITCSFGVVAALLAIAVTLATHQSQPLQQWPYRFSINSLVAAYSVVLKGAMLVIVSTGISQLKWTWFNTARSLRDIDDWDQASRGVWGSLLLIWRLRGQHFTATIGAFVTIFALGVDPMLQFLVRYDDCNIQQSIGVAQIPRSNLFPTVGYHIGADLNSLPGDLINTITAGYFSPETPSVTATCTTGNCTFSDAYHSLGYCSQCEDVSSKLSLNCWDYTGYYTTVWDNGTVTNSSYPAHKCNYSLPNGFDNVFETSGYLQSYLKMGGDFYDISFSVITNNLTYFNNVTIDNKPYKYEDCSGTTQNSSSWICNGFGAATCTLEPCIMSYVTSITNGKQQENITAISRVFNESYDEATYGGTPLITAVNVNCLSTHSRQQLIDLHYPITNSTNWIGYRGNGFYYDGPEFSFNSSTPNATIPDECLYRMSELNEQSIHNYLYDLLTGNVTGGQGSSNYLFETDGPPAPTKLFNTGNASFESVNSTFANVAAAISVYMRQMQTSEAANYPANGTVLKDEICIGVRWPFLILPSILVAATLLFFVLMIIETSARLQGCDWKDSALALLFHGIHQDGTGNPRPTTMEIDTKERMSIAARHIDVKLGRDPPESDLGFKVIRQR